MGAKKRRSRRTRTVPKWLKEEDSKHWLVLPDWRLAFEKEKTRLIKTAVLRFARINGIVVFSSLILTSVIWIISFDILLKSPTLISIANII